MADTANPTPSIGEWYLDSETEEEFEVVAVDEDSGTVEVQYFDGAISEFNRDDWNGHKLSRIEAPEDWTGALEPVEPGDVNYDEESVDLPPKHALVPGFEQDEVLLTEEANTHEEPIGTEAEED